MTCHSFRTVSDTDDPYTFTFFLLIQVPIIIYSSSVRGCTKSNRMELESEVSTEDVSREEITICLVGASLCFTTLNATKADTITEMAIKAGIYQRLLQLEVKANAEGSWSICMRSLSSRRVLAKRFSSPVGFSGAKNRWGRSHDELLSTSSLVW